MVLEPEPQRVLVQGRDVGEPPIRARGPLRLRWRHLARDRGPRRVGRLPHWRALVLLPGASDRPCSRRAVTTEAGPEGRRRFFELAAERAVVPVWRELIADTITPVGAFTQVGG